LIQKHRFGDAVKLIFCFLTFVSPCMRAQSPSARETLRQYVADLKRDPDSQSLREKIIKVVQELKPVPEIPEDARRCFVEGTTIAKTATDKSQQALAVTSFKDALKIAPWWGDAYFNLAVAEELTGQLDEAEASLKLYILTNPGDKEVREAQDHIYALGAKKKLAAADRATQEKRAEAERVV